MYWEGISTWFEKRANAEALYWAGVLIWTGLAGTAAAVAVLKWKPELLEYLRSLL